MQNRPQMAADPRLEQLPPDPFTRPRPLKEESKTAMPTTRDVTRLPNWLMPLICSAFIGLVAVVYGSMQGNIAALKQDQKDAMVEMKRAYDREFERQAGQIEKLEAYMHNTREWVKGYGFDIDDNGRITKRK